LPLPVANPRIQSRPSALDLGQPLIEIYPDWERAAEVGLNTSTLGTTVAILTNGAYLDDFYLDDEKIDLYDYGHQAGDIDLDGLATLPIHTPSGVNVPLREVLREVLDHLRNAGELPASINDTVTFLPALTVAVLSWQTKAGKLEEQSLKCQAWVAFAHKSFAD
jgi:hypothetical protein